MRCFGTYSSYAQTMLRTPGVLTYFRTRLPTRHEKYFSHRKIPEGHINFNLVWGSGFRVQGSWFMVKVMDKGLWVFSNGCDLGQGGSLKIDKHSWNIFRCFFTESVWTDSLAQFQIAFRNRHSRNCARTCRLLLKHRCDN